MTQVYLYFETWKARLDRYSFGEGGGGGEGGESA